MVDGAVDREGQERARRAASPTVRRMGLHDLQFVVQSHGAHFPEGFFVRLGPRFLSRYYRTFLDGPSATALVIESEGMRLGYVAGVLRGAEHRRLVLRYHGQSLALLAVLRMLTRPRLAIFFVRTRITRYTKALRRAWRTSAPQGKFDPALPGSGRHAEVAVLSHIVVTEPERCRGLGRALVETFLGQARDAGCAGARLVTSCDEDGAAAFYAKLGWIREPETSKLNNQTLLHFRYDLEAEA